MKKILVISCILIAAAGAAAQDKPRQVSREEAAAFLKEHYATFRRPEAVKLAILFVATRGKSEEERGRLNVFAEELRARAVAEPGAFEALVEAAKEPGCGYVATPEYYYAKTDEFLALFGYTFRVRALSLKKGEISICFGTPTGLYVLKAMETYPEKSLGLDDPITLGEDKTVYEAIRDYLAGGGR